MVNLQFTKRQIQALHECVEYMLDDKHCHLQWCKDNKESYPYPKEIVETANDVKVLKNIIVKLSESK
jgi:superfamily II DNA helicase RecQ